MYVNCVTTAFIGDVPFFALADGTVHWLDHGSKSAAVHDGLLCAIADHPGKRLISGGEDGKVNALLLDGSVATLGEMGRKWVTSIAVGPQGAVAFASGRNATVRFADGKTKEFTHPRSVEG
ncbi:WD40 repeat domain-containing protein, partial [Rhizobiaceae sp. 2RAB30]